MRQLRGSLFRPGILAGSLVCSAALFAACGGSADDDGGGGSGGTGGTGTGGSGTGGATTGGTGGTTGGTGGTAAGGSMGGLGGSMGGLGGSMGGQMGEECTAPFDEGDCDAAIPVYWHNPVTGLCETAVWGGCDGNDNRYETLEDCMETCDVTPTGASCEVDGMTYPDGTNVPDPFSCNTCLCLDGEITNCTEINCPEPCDDGTGPGSECASCGPTDECLSVRTGCLDTCSDEDECDGGLCSDGLCRNLCG